MTRVFVAPSRTRNPFALVLEIAFPIIAACPLPSPGRKLHNGDAISAPRIGFKIFVFGFSIFCFGIFILFFMLRINIDEPKSPVNSGRRDSFAGNFKTMKPSKPVSKTTNNDRSFFFSKRIKRNRIAIRMYGINFAIVSYTFGIIKIDGKEIKIKMKIAARLP